MAKAALPPAWWEQYDVKALPKQFKFAGVVVKGFNRGSKLLGYPTANINPEAFAGELDNSTEGVYFGWVRVEDGPIYKAVLSIGWNPHFENKERTVETYIVHEFLEDFYGAKMKLLITGYLRPQLKFESMDDLIAAIATDVEMGSDLLDKAPHRAFSQDPFLTDGNKNIPVASALPEKDVRAAAKAKAHRDREKAKQLQTNGKTEQQPEKSGKDPVSEEEEKEKQPAGTSHD